MNMQEIVALEGGPEGAPCACRVEDLSLVDTERAVISYCGCNEHYASTGEMQEVEGQDVPLYRWSYRTRIAE
ncbi:DUF5988 family protein [Streptomyces sp. XY431]|uniref:DUF5988 family protein n=1 Tax=Streptomyces sp. XY431 TaxID=1415562 RepID=UPI000A6DD7E6|nr:DUF5988 family protein [Streptomyces sp. XY431]